MPDSFMDVLWYCWSAFTWFFHAEERLAIVFDDNGLANWKQVPILIIINMLIIAWEIWMYDWLIKLYNWIFKNRQINPKKHHTPKFVLAITRGKPVGIPELFMLAFIPTCQKFGSFIYAAQRKFFGIKGFVALNFGGGLRLVIMVFLPKESIWYIIIGMIVARVITWWFENGYNKPNKNNSP